MYGNIKEEIPRDAQTQLGQLVILIQYMDAHLYYNIITVHSVTVILHFINCTHIEWCLKKQATSKTATYGPECVATRTCVDQIIDLTTTIRYIGVPIHGPIYRLGDNESTINSSTKMKSKLHTRSNLVSFHRVQETIAADIYSLYHIISENKRADILTNYWP